jgi:predicted anti-sigma-YlaC factor YlaD
MNGWTAFGTYYAIGIMMGVTVIHGDQGFYELGRDRLHPTVVDLIELFVILLVGVLWPFILGRSVWRGIRDLLTNRH